LSSPITYHNIADTREHTIEELNKEEHAAAATLEAIRQRITKVQQEAEEKWRAEEAEAKCKPEEAEGERVTEEAWKAKEAQKTKVAAKEARAAKAKAKKEKAEKIRVANAAMQEGLLAHEAEKKRVAEEAPTLKVLALVKRQQELTKLGVPPKDLLMQAPEGLGPSREEMRKICKEVARQAKKRKYGDTQSSVSRPKHQCRVN
jgi:hypothetical protein